jgi:isoleucyl-tRNA synthetase
VLAFTAEEIWGHLPRLPGDPDSVHLAALPTEDATRVDEDLAARFESILTVRSAVTQAMEPFRAQKHQSLDAAVTVGLPAALRPELEAVAELLNDYFIVSSVSLTAADGDDVDVTVAEHSGGKCPRCWKCVDDSVTVTVNEEVNEGVCVRCAAVLEELVQ